MLSRNAILEGTEMYCPNCGKENSVEQRFCRSCGLSLQTISQALTHELSVTESPDKSVEVFNHERKGWQNPLLYGFLIIMLGLIIAIFGKLILAEKLIADIGVVIALLGVGLLGIKGVLIMLPQSRVAPKPKTQLQGEPMVMQTSALQPGEPASVTDHTTRALESVYEEPK
jgi:hypothetical protein